MISHIFSLQVALIILSQLASAYPKNSPFSSRAKWIISFDSDGQVQSKSFRSHQEMQTFIDTHRIGVYEWKSIPIHTSTPTTTTTTYISTRYDPNGRLDSIRGEYDRFGRLMFNPDGSLLGPNARGKGYPTIADIHGEPVTYRYNGRGVRDPNGLYDSNRQKLIFLYLPPTVVVEQNPPPPPPTMKTITIKAHGRIWCNNRWDALENVRMEMYNNVDGIKEHHQKIGETVTTDGIGSAGFWSITARVKVPSNDVVKPFLWCQHICNAAHIPHYKRYDLAPTSTDMDYPALNYFLMDAQDNMEEETYTGDVPNDYRVDTQHAT